MDKKTQAKELLFLFIGCVLYSVSVILLEPMSLIPGSAIGIAMVIHAALGYMPGLVNFLINVPIMALCTLVYGRKILVYTILVLIMTSLMVDGWMPYFAWVPVLDYPIPVTIFSAAIMGLGMGFIVRAGGSSGGTSALGTLLKKYIPWLRLDMFMGAADILIIGAGALVLKSTKILLSSYLYVGVCYLVMGQLTDRKKKETLPIEEKAAA